MMAAVGSAWALFFGLALIMIGNGLQGALLGVRAELEGFGGSVTGLIMTGYFVGFLLGSRVVPLLIARVGHVRTFAALASLTSISILIHPSFVDPSVWTAMRFLTGLGYAGLYIVCESWLNDRATNETRGQLLAAYMIVMLGGAALGSLLLGAADPLAFSPFILISVLMSFAVIPILLSAAPAPVVDQPENMSLKRLYQASPLGVVGAFLVGATQGLFFGMGAVFATRAGLTVGETSIFMMSAFIGGMLLTWPIGRLSDILDRRLVLTVTTFCAALAAAAGALATGQLGWLLFAAMALFGGFNQPLYSLCIAHTNDFLTPKQMVRASGTLVMMIGLGSIAGPMIAAVAMDWVGPWGYFWALAALQTLLGLFALYRITRRAARPLEEQGAYVAVPAASTPVTASLNPEIDWPEPDAAAEPVSDDLPEPPLAPDERAPDAIDPEDPGDDRADTPLKA
ncbi:MAG: MFS transporter [Alphaproteobacteria bacterium]|nr:MFS transporter [Alphaproteobacteria bacterium]